MNKKYKRNETKNNIISTLVLILVVALGLGVWYSDYSVNCQTTKDAYVEGRLLSISPRISGYVAHVYVNNNQEVKKGDLLFEIDSSYYEDALRNAVNELDNVKLKLRELAANENLDQNQTNIRPKSAHSKFNFANMGYDKYARMYDEIIVENQTNEVDKSTLLATDKTVKPQNTAVKPQPDEKEVKPEKTVEELTADVKRLESVIEQAKLDLSNTKIYASQDGVISAKNVAEGDYVEPGQPALSIIPKHVWISANYKNYQADKICAGQPVVIKIDKYPRRRFKGVVASVQNYPITSSSVPKDVVPVRIMFTEDYSEYDITPGTAVTLTVRTK